MENERKVTVLAKGRGFEKITILQAKKEESAEGEKKRRVRELGDKWRGEDVENVRGQKKKEKRHNKTRVKALIKSAF